MHTNHRGTLHVALPWHHGVLVPRGASTTCSLSRECSALAQAQAPSSWRWWRRRWRRQQDWVGQWVEDQSGGGLESAALVWDLWLRFGICGLLSELALVVALAPAARSICTGSICTGSSCTGSICTGSICTGSICTGSSCTRSICTGSSCTGSSCRRIHLHRI